MTYIVAIFEGESRRSIAAVRDDSKFSDKEDAEQRWAELNAEGFHVGIFTTK